MQSFILRYFFCICILYDERAIGQTRISCCLTRRDGSLKMQVVYLCLSLAITQGCSKKNWQLVTSVYPFSSSFVRFNNNDSSYNRFSTCGRVRSWAHREWDKVPYPPDNVVYKGPGVVFIGTKYLKVNNFDAFQVHRVLVDAFQVDTLGWCLSVACSIRH